MSYWQWCNIISINIPGRGECVHADPNQHMCWEPDSCGEDRPFMCRASVDRAKSDHCKIRFFTSFRMTIDVLSFKNILQYQHLITSLFFLGGLIYIYKGLLLTELSFLFQQCTGLLGKHKCNGDRKCIDTRAGPLCVKPGF